MIRTEKSTFLSKKVLFCFAIQKKAVPLHPQSRDCQMERRDSSDG
jgi:hypothetical protein